MYKVFVNEKVIYFTNNEENYRHLNNCLVINYFNPNITPAILNLLSKCIKTQVVVILVPDYEASFIKFKSYFKIIEAAGGIVINKRGEKLFIFRLNKWDLPKGKIEKGEKIEEAAIREIEEECGVSDLSIVKPLQDTFHIYQLKENLILKQTHWFQIKSNYNGKLIPQIEENITKVEWLNNHQIKDKVIKNTYSSITELLRASDCL
jgi:8-oxo-dGTP pyrophosphatase MutT (NUDIX family)